MEKRNIVEEGRTPGFVKKATAVDDFEKRAKAAFSAFVDRGVRKPVKPDAPVRRP